MNETVEVFAYLAPGVSEKQFYGVMRPANAAGILAAMNIDKLHQLYTFILAGGQGERLYPLTQSRPKPAVSFGGLFRMIDFTLSNCLHSMLPEVEDGAGRALVASIRGTVNWDFFYGKQKTRFVLFAVMWC